MKRGAEKQLSKDREEDDDVEETEPGTGFKKADEAALAGRKIRGLPKRFSMASAPAPPQTDDHLRTKTAPEPAPTTSRFGSFAGFGAPASGSTPFSFSSTAAKPADQSTSSPFASKPLDASAVASAFKPAPTSAFTSVSPSASSATKTLASFLSSPASTFSKGAAITKEPAASAKENAPVKEAPPSAPAPALSSLNEDPEYKYWLSLRGLNHSFLLAVQSAVEKDPFADVAEMLEQYKNLRIGVQKDYDSSRNGSKEKVDSKPSAPTRTLSMPTAPSSFAGFSLAPPTTNGASRSGGGGFTPKLETSTKSSIGFSLTAVASNGVASTAASEAPKTAFSFGGATTSKGDSKEASSEGPKSAFSFGGSSGSTLSAAGTAETKSTFSFGGVSSTSSSTLSAPAKGAFSTFAFTGASAGSVSGEPSSTGSAVPKSAFTFGSAPSSQPKPLFGMTDTSSSLFGSKPAAPTSSGSTFGNLASAPKADNVSDDKKAAVEVVPPSGGTSLFGSPVGTPGAGTPFGAATPGSPFSGFGRKTSGSIGNPVGFGFGSPPRTPGASTPAEGPLSSTPKPALPVFTLGAPPPALPKDAGGEEQGGEGGEDGAAPPPEQQLFGASVHDEEGPGEENEDTMHACRVKVFQMKKGDKQWADVGVGMLRLKKSKESEARRMLLRNSSTGKLIINFALYSGMNPSIAEKVVSFVGHGASGDTVTYKLRVKTTDQAQALKAAIDHELAVIGS